MNFIQKIVKKIVELKLLFYFYICDQKKRKREEFIECTLPDSTWILAE